MEKKLIKKVKKGDAHSFKVLYELYFEYAMRNAMCILKEQSRAGDAVQETFIRVYNNIHTFDETKAFKPWFSKILINECYRIIEKNKVKIQPIDELHSLSEKEEKNPEEEYEELYQAIYSLDETHRVPIILKYLNEMSEKEMAEILEINQNTLKSRLFKARKRLGKILGGDKNE